MKAAKRTPLQGLKPAAELAAEAGKGGRGMKAIFLAALAGMLSIAGLERPRRPVLHVDAPEPVEASPPPPRAPAIAESAQPGIPTPTEPSAIAWPGEMQSLERALGSVDYSHAPRPQSGRQGARVAAQVARARRNPFEASDRCIERIRAREAEYQRALERQRERVLAAKPEKGEGGP